VLNASASTAKSQRVKEATGAERRRGRAAGRRHARGSAPFRTPRKWSRSHCPSGSRVVA